MPHRRGDTCGSLFAVPWTPLVPAIAAHRGPPKPVPDWKGMTDRQTRDRMEIRRKLPRLPAHVLHVVQLALSPDADLAATAAAIATDADLAARILRIANSPLYPTRREIDNLRKALMIIGFNATLTLALCFSLSAMFRPLRQISLDRQRIWHRSVLAATACKVLTSRLGWRNSEEVMLAALLQDLGQLVLAQEFPQDYSALLARQLPHHEIPEQETALIGCSHIEVGAWMAHDWGLPDYLGAAIRESHEDYPLEPLERAVALSGLIADTWVGLDHEAAHLLAIDGADRLFGLRGNRYSELLAAVQAALPEMAALFDVKLIEKEAQAQHKTQAAAAPGSVEASPVDTAIAEAARTKSRIAKAVAPENRDAVTGIFHRDYVAGVLATEFAVARRHAWDFSIVLVRLENYGPIMAAGGQTAADAVLRRVAEVLVNTLRDEDVTGRVREDAFLILLPGTGRKFALLVRDRLISACKGAILADDDPATLLPKLSLGIADLDPAAPCHSAQELIQAAERDRHAPAT